MSRRFFMTLGLLFPLMVPRALFAESPAGTAGGGSNPFAAVEPAVVCDGTVLRVDGRKLLLPSWIAGDVRVDDLFGVYEDAGTDLATMGTMRRLGWVRVTDILDDTPALPEHATAIAVGGRRFRKGMVARRLPTSPFALDIGVTYIPYRVTKGRLVGANRVYMDIADDKDRMIILGQVGATLNLSRWIGPPQTFVELRASLGGTALGGRYDDGRVRDTGALSYGVSSGLFRRFFLGPTGLHLGAGYGVLVINSTYVDSTAGRDPTNGQVVAWLYGPVAEGGLSLWVGPRFVVSLLAERRWYDQHPAWRMAFNGSSPRYYGDPAPELSFERLNLRLAVSWNRKFF